MKAAWDWFRRLMSCGFRCNTGHRPVFDSIHLCLVLLPPSLPPAVPFPAIHISFSIPLPLWPWGVQCSACLVMLSSFFHNVCPSQSYFLLHIWSSTGSWDCGFISIVRHNIAQVLTALSSLASTSTNRFLSILTPLPEEKGRISAYTLYF